MKLLIGNNITNKNKHLWGIHYGCGNQQTHLNTIISDEGLQCLQIEL